MMYIFKLIKINGSYIKIFKILHIFSYKEKKKHVWLKKFVQELNRFLSCVQKSRKTEECQFLLFCHIFQTIKSDCFCPTWDHKIKSAEFAILFWSISIVVLSISFSIAMHIPCIINFYLKYGFFIQIFHEIYFTSVRA